MRVKEFLVMLDDAQLQRLADANKLNTAITGIAKAGWDFEGLKYYVDQVIPRLSGNPALDLFDQLADIPGNLVFRLHAISATNQGVVNEMKVAIMLRNQGETIEGMSISFDDGTGKHRDIDIVTSTRNIEVKPKLEASVDDSTYKQLKALKSKSIDLGKAFNMYAFTPFNQLKANIQKKLIQNGITQSDYFTYTP